MLYFMSALRPYDHLAGVEGIGTDHIKLFSCSAQLRMKFVLLMDLRLPVIANSFLLNTAEHEDFSANKI